jgi:hypothetical protein
LVENAFHRPIVWQIHFPPGVVIEIYPGWAWCRKKVRQGKVIPGRFGQGEGRFTQVKAPGRIE